MEDFPAAGQSGSACDTGPSKVHKDASLALLEGRQSDEVQCERLVGGEASVVERNRQVRTLNRQFRPRELRTRAPGDVLGGRGEGAAKTKESEELVMAGHG